MRSAGLKNIAVITARSGSKGLKDKNIKPLNGKPLLAHSIEAAFASGMFDTVHLSTDSEQYAEIGREFGADVPFLRSIGTSTDTASSWDVILEVLENYRRLGKKFDTVMLLQPTSPLRTAEDICGAYQVMEDKKAKAVVSVCETEHSPLWCNTLPENGCMDGFCHSVVGIPRQKLERYYRVNGAIYLLSVSVLLEQGSLVYGPDCYAYIMPKERSIDIDEPLDFVISGVILQNKGSSNLPVTINVREKKR